MRKGRYDRDNRVYLALLISGIIRTEIIFRERKRVEVKFVEIRIIRVDIYVGPRSAVNR